MKLEHGLLPGQVLQRDGRNRGAARVVGTAAAAAAVQVRVSQKERPLRGFDWKMCGRAKAGRFEARIAGLPVGGPYVIELRVGAETARVKDIFVGDVWVLAGQSNMEGLGYLSEADTPHPMVRAFFMRDEWGMAKDPVHFLAESVDSVHSSSRRDAHVGVGPAVTFGKEMFRRTGVPQGLVPCAHGGSSMSQWDPRLKGKGGASLYGSMMRRFKRLGQPVAGLAWYQGCSDSNATAAQRYTKRMKALISAIRRDFGEARLPVVAVQIGRVHRWERANEAGWNSVQDQQRRLPEAIQRLVVVPTVDLEMDDHIHIGAKGHLRLGRRMAGAMDALVRGRRAGAPQIVLHSVRLVKDAVTGTCNIRVRFDNVKGRLRAEGRPTGFSLRDAQGNDMPAIYSVRLFGAEAELRTVHDAAALTALHLHYGRGSSPYCNITDEADRAVPVFGPVRLKA